MEESKQPAFNYEDLIWQKPGSLSPEFCALIIQKFEEDDRTYPGTTLRGDDTTLKRTRDLSISSLSGWEEVDTQIFEALGPVLAEYGDYCRSLNPELIYMFRNTELADTGYLLQKYDHDPETPGHYDWHHDYSIDRQGTRLLTFMWYLNEVELGGETEFLNSRIRPETGKLVIFPAGWQYLHRALPPISNPKWICTGWIYSKWQDPTPPEGPK